MKLNRKLRMVGGVRRMAVRLDGEIEFVAGMNSIETVAKSSRAGARWMKFPRV